jgi:hypothetical protein
LNDATDIVAENLAQDFVDLRRLSFASQSFTKFAFYHRESAFDVAATVIIFHKLCSVEMEKVKHIFPNKLETIEFDFENESADELDTVQACWLAFLIFKMF